MAEGGRGRIRALRTIRGRHPPGGVISPLLANLALDGIELLFAGKWWARVVKYADDFVVVAATEQIIGRTIRPEIERFLAERGLELNAQKTGVVSVSHGFNFLGFTLREFGGALIVTPQKEKVQRILRHLKEILVANKQAPHRDLLALLNPVIRGWVNYYRFSNAKRVFGHVDHLLFRKVWRWAPTPVELAPLLQLAGASAGAEAGTRTKYQCILLQ